MIPTVLPFPLIAIFALGILGGYYLACLVVFMIQFYRF